MDRRVEKAIEVFGKNYNCAQSVFAAFAPDDGIDEAKALAVSSAYGAGIARSGQICGAVSGALLAIGLRVGKSCADDPMMKLKVYYAAQEFIHKFNKAHGSNICTDLLDIGMEMNSNEAWEKAIELDLHNTKCPVFVRTASEILCEMFDAEQSQG